MPDKIICIHIGARAHYLLPKALASQDKLEMLVTDTWIKEKWMRKLLSRFPLRLVKSFANRFTEEIGNKKIKHFSIPFLVAEIRLRLKYKNDWSLIIARNDKFQQKALPVFLQLPPKTVLGISYTSLEIFKAAEKRGQKKILFQIDPAIKEEKIVAAITEQNAALYPSAWQKAPEILWENWKKECSLSQVIMVNSEWSKKGLIEEGINGEKIKVVPLPFQLNDEHLKFRKAFPEVFTKERPLQCLFLGTLTLRKGIHLVLEAAALLQDYPVEFILVGSSEIAQELLNSPNTKYKGLATRSETDEFYRNADVFLFPTFSDGFGLTQLEAMAWQVPVIATLFCGEVVTNKKNGIVLQDNTASKLADSLVHFINAPEELKFLSDNCLATVQEYNTGRFARELANL
ncbi:MAG TPA: glycosyltransferase family 4 protein [Chitinophagaceae bacterium]|nr:glycosyltransferase family 4 protein [Chitinophagaceae bacterium]